MLCCDFYCLYIFVVIIKLWNKLGSIYQQRQLQYYYFIYKLNNQILTFAQDQIFSFSTMNVDKDNFHEVRKFITQNNLIKKSKFISFDLQFTGVKFDNNQRDKYDMFLNDKYLKMVSVASKFNIVQIGLTFVVQRQNLNKQNEKNMVDQQQQKQLTKKMTKTQQQQNSTSKYIAYPYNFYVFPRQSSTSNPVISMQASCIQFNTQNDMDWNRWIRKGITYTRISQFNKQLQNISVSNINSIVTITNSTCNNGWTNGKHYNQFLEEMSQKLRNIVIQIVKESDGKNVGWSHIAQVPKYGVSNIRRAIEIYANQYSINFMITKLVQKQFQTQLQAQVEQEQPKQQLIQLKIEIISQQTKKDQQQIKKQQILGFSLIWQQIWNTNKTLVGHHCLFDLLFIYSSFVDQLPKDYRNFKKIVGQIQKQGGEIGKQFYDTKYIANKLDKGTKIFKKGTSLQQLYKYLKQKSIQSGKNQKTLVSLAPNFSSYDLDKPVLHEAGFDSFLTAWVYLHLSPKQQDQGKISIHKSYFLMNLRILHDQIRNDMKIFVIAIVLNNAYVPYQQLRNMRAVLSKTIRDELHKQHLMNDTIVIDGFKQLFLSMKDINRTDQLIKFLLNLKKNKIIKKDNLVSLQSWVKMRAQVFAQMSVNVNSSMNKVK